MAKDRKVFLTIGVIFLIFLGLYIVREIFILKRPGEIRTLWQEWTRTEPSIEEQIEALRKLEREIEELEKVRKQLDEIEAEREKR